MYAYTLNLYVIQYTYQSLDKIPPLLHLCDWREEEKNDIEYGTMVLRNNRNISIVRLGTTVGSTKIECYGNDDDVYNIHMM